MWLPIAASPLEYRLLVVFDLEDNDCCFQNSLYIFIISKESDFSSLGFSPIRQYSAQLSFGVSISFLIYALTPTITGEQGIRPFLKAR